MGAETADDLIMTKWEAEGVGRGHEESGWLCSDTNKVLSDFPRVKESVALGAAPVQSPRLVGATRELQSGAG